VGHAIREVRTVDELAEVYRLTHRVYAHEGYCEHTATGQLRHYSHLDAIDETTVLIATEKSLVIGSHTTTLDGPLGLHTDHDYPEEMKELRRQGKRLAAAWRLVTDPLYRGRRRLIMDLLGATIHRAFDRGIEYLVTDVHPDHKRFYTRFVGMETLAVGTCEAVGGMPSVLMGYDRGKGIPRRWCSEL
jgi:hypothetical protein